MYEMMENAAQRSRTKKKDFFTVFDDVNYPALTVNGL